MSDAPHDSLELARTAYDDGVYDEAMTLVRALVDEKTYGPAEDGQVRALEIACLDALGLNDEAAARVDDVLGLDLMACREIGSTLVELAATTPADRLLRTLIERDPKEIEALLALALLLEAQERIEEALGCLAEAGARDDACAEAPLHEARLRAEAGDTDGAADAYRRYLALQPDDAENWVSLAIVESERDAGDAADDAFRQAIRLDPEFVGAHYNRAVTAARYDDRDRIAEALVALAEVAPEDWRTAMTRAMLCEQDGQAWPGWEACQEALDLAENDPNDYEGHAAAVEAALAFLIRCEMATQTDTVIEHAFEHTLLTPGVLALIREHEDRPSETAQLYFVLIEGRVTDADLLEDLRESYPNTTGDFVYCRAFQVVAENEGEAAETAVACERRLARGDDLHMDEIEAVGDREPGFRGVVLCSPMHIAPDFEGQADVDDDDDDESDD